MSEYDSALLESTPPTQHVLLDQDITDYSKTPPNTKQKRKKRGTLTSGFCPIQIYPLLTDNTSLVVKTTTTTTTPVRRSEVGKVEKKYCYYVLPNCKRYKKFCGSPPPLRLHKRERRRHLRKSSLINFLDFVQTYWKKKANYYYNNNNNIYYETRKINYCVWYAGGRLALFFIIFIATLLLLIMSCMLLLSFTASLLQFSAFIQAYRHCPTTTNAELERMLGAAYNPRYQSFYLPSASENFASQHVKEDAIDPSSSEDLEFKLEIKNSPEKGKKNGEEKNGAYGDSVSLSERYRHPYPDHASFVGNPGYERIITNGPFSDLLKVVKQKARRHLASWMEASQKVSSTPQESSPRSSNSDKIRHRSHKKRKERLHSNINEVKSKKTYIPSTKTYSTFQKQTKHSAPEFGLQGEDPTRYKFEEDLREAEKSEELERLTLATKEKLKTAFSGYSRAARKREQSTKFVDLQIDSGVSMSSTESNTSRTFAQERSKRSAPPQSPWGCQSKVGWIDLGPDHFPRYVRNLTCIANPCWFKRGSCRGKGFYIKVLHRMADKCIEVPPEDYSKFGILPEEATRKMDSDAPKLREPWVWKEITITFCCECVLQ